MPFRQSKTHSLSITAAVEYLLYGIIMNYKVGGSNPECIGLYTKGMTKNCNNYVGNQFYNSNKARQVFVIYCLYATTKGCIQALHVALCLRTALSHGILAIFLLLKNNMI